MTTTSITQLSSNAVLYDNLIQCIIIGVTPIATVVIADYKVFCSSDTELIDDLIGEVTHRWLTSS